MTSEAVNGETSEAFIEEDWSNLLTWPLSRRRSSNESHHLLLNGDVKTTLLLNLNPNPKDDVDIHTATIFESRQESSIFYQRQVDDVIVVNSNIKQGSNGAAHSAESQPAALASNTSLSSSIHTVSGGSDPHKRLCNAIAIAKKGYNPLCSKKRALIGEENTVGDTICKEGCASTNVSPQVKLLNKLEPNGINTKELNDSKLSSKKQ